MKFLIVCTGNTCRSPMAEGIMNYLVKANNMDIMVKSAGVFAVDGDRVSTNAIKAMKNKGIDISNYKSTFLHEELINEADIILTMSNSHRVEILRRYPQAKGKTYQINEYALGKNKDISDPFGGDLMTYEIVRDELYCAIEKIIEDIGKK